VPRLTDLHAVLASTAGKIELEYAGEDKKAEDLIERLIGRAVMARGTASPSTLARVVEHFESGWGVEVSDRMPAAEYREGVQKTGLRGRARLGPSGRTDGRRDRVRARGLPPQKLNKEREGGRWGHRA
jgi:magnesium chelatase subunit I